MFFSFRLTAARLLAAVTLIVCTILAFDAVGQLKTEKPILCATDFERAEYLKCAGVHVDPSPVWVKSLCLPESPDSLMAEYMSTLEAQGYELDEYIGEKLTLYCYKSVENNDVFARVIMCDDTLVAADAFVYGNDKFSLALTTLTSSDT